MKGHRTHMKLDQFLLFQAVSFSSTSSQPSLACDNIYFGLSFPLCKAHSPPSLDLCAFISNKSKFRRFNSTGRGCSARSTDLMLYFCLFLSMETTFEKSTKFLPVSTRPFFGPTPCNLLLYILTRPISFYDHRPIWSEFKLSS